MNTETYLQDYVKMGLALQGIPVDAQRLVSVTEQFALLTAIANVFLVEPLSAELESASIYQL